MNDMFAYEGMPKKLKKGKYCFAYFNETNMQHDLKVGKKKTPIFTKGQASLNIKLKKKQSKVKYECTVPGHKEAGMRGKIKIKG